MWPGRKSGTAEGSQPIPFRVRASAMKIGIVDANIIHCIDLEGGCWRRSQSTGQRSDRTEDMSEHMIEDRTEDMSEHRAEE